MDKSLYNASGCKDRTAHDAICAADRTRTLVYRVKGLSQVWLLHWL